MGICEDCKKEFENELLNENGICKDCQKDRNQKARKRLHSNKRQFVFLSNLYTGNVK